MQNKNLPQRKPTRLPNFDYSTNGLYSVTICTKEKQKILSKIVGGGVPDAPHTVLLPCGKIVDKYINQMNEQYNNINIENYVIMPNHIHLLIFVDNPNGTSGKGGERCLWQIQRTGRRESYEQSRGHLCRRRVRR